MSEKMMMAAVGLGLAGLAPAPAAADTVTIETLVKADPATVWAAVRDVYRVHEVLAPGFVTDVRAEDGARVVTFEGGLVIRERIVTIDDAARRMAYSAFGGRATYHMASMHVLAEGEASRIVWTTDFLPSELKPFITANMTRGAEVMRRTLETRAVKRER